MDKNFLIGMDVGSTTVKAVVIDAATDEIVWRDYQRHDTKQPEKVLEFLKRFEVEIEGFAANRSRMFITGSGGNGMAKYLGAKFVQEVNAVSLAVERLYPECGSVIELGGQDAEIIIFKKDPETGRKKKIPSMNDKCAGGTGAVIDKINAKLRIPAEQLCQMGYKGLKLFESLYRDGTACSRTPLVPISRIRSLGHRAARDRHELRRGLTALILQSSPLRISERTPVLDGSAAGSVERR